MPTSSSLPTSFPPSPQLPINDINQFINEVRNLVDNIVNYWNQLLIPSDLRQDLKDAWAEVEQRFDALDLSDTQAMIDAGLASQSPELKLKLGILNHIWKRFADFGVSWLDDLLDAINDVLDSVPGAEALAEFKKAIENLIKITRREGH